jgi:GNAT superfamily N-acetyltransferase
MSGELDIVGIRDALDDDRAFVVDSWLMSFRLSHFAGPISMRRYRDVYSLEIEDLLLRPLCCVRVAYNNLSPGQIFGFLCFEGGHKHPVIHYLYVKQPLRRRGIAKLLVQDASINLDRRFVYTYRTPLAHDLTKRGSKYERGKFMPQVARFEPEDKDHHHVQD